MSRAAASTRDGRRGAADDAALVKALRTGDERVFARLVESWSGVMLRVARSRVDSAAVAEEVVQDAWLTVLRRLDRFEQRSSLRTWVLGIVVNLARARSRVERRSVPVPDEPAGPVVDAARFRPPDADRWPDHWAAAPLPWPAPEEELLAGEARDVILRALARLPPAQREVLALRDLAGLTGPETCEALGLSEGNQRVLLHRARSRVRSALEGYFLEEAT